MGLCLTELDRILPLSREEFEREYVATPRPVVIRGLMDGWPALRKWSPEYFRRTAGAMKALAAPMQDDGHSRIRATPQFKTFLGFAYDSSYDEMSLASFLDTLEGNTRPYYLSTATLEFPEEIRRDYTLPPYCEGAPYVHSRIWCGRSGTVVPLHRDLTSVFYCQILGRKRFYFFSPDQNRYLYARYPLPGMANFSPVDAEYPDMEAFPRLEKARGLYCDLEPGDMVYFPRGYWHQTVAFGLNIAINFFCARGFMGWAGAAAKKFRQLGGMHFAR